ncbi:hypothetical protein [Paenibacillus apiarius]|uniref:hypothetical protein n=1 Tax=Paenibacillus apiarius TaxID=46240 RepID=UPI00197F7E87|nr:hypothetical protein [Paenibacillus apiarius]MBN3525633.1 hypothetical protein [Paenibacillus apiarius]
MKHHVMTAGMGVVGNNPIQSAVNGRRSGYAMAARQTDATMTVRGASSQKVPRERSSSSLDDGSDRARRSRFLLGAVFVYNGC